MTVANLVALLSCCDPRDTVICDARSEALLVIANRGGMHPQWEEEQTTGFNADDEEFLTMLHIHPGR